MEDGLVQIMKISVKGGGAVLILVVMEDGLVQQISNIHYKFIRLNPCCNGRWSRTKMTVIERINANVLILVVMEDGLVLDLIRLY